MYSYEEQHPVIEKFFLRISAVIITIAALISFYYFYLTFFSPKVIVYKNVPFPVLTKNVHPGEALLINISYCKYYDVLPSERIGTLISDTNYQVQAITITRKFPNGCYNNYKFNGYIIPIGTPPGRYHIEADVTYVVNGLAIDHEHYYTQKFNVE